MSDVVTLTLNPAISRASTRPNVGFGDNVEIT
jgi:hypothetical protein